MLPPFSEFRGDRHQRLGTLRKSAVPLPCTQLPPIRQPDPERNSLTALSYLLAINPIVTWNEIAKKLQSKSWHVNFYTRNLLAGHGNDDHLPQGGSFAA